MARRQGTLPTREDLLQMDLKELNHFIDLYGKRANARIAALRKKRESLEEWEVESLSIDTTIEAIEKSAGQYNPKRNAGTGKAKTFYRGASPEKENALSRAKIIYNALANKRTTYTGAKAARDASVKEMVRQVFQVTDEEADEITGSYGAYEYQRFRNLISKAREYKIGSDTIAQLVNLERQQKKFSSWREFFDWMEEELDQEGNLEFDYYEI